MRTPGTITLPTLLLVTLCGAPTHGAPLAGPPAAIARMSPRRLDRALRQQARRPLPGRIGFWSRQFLRTPYWVPPKGAVIPLGHDFQRVDCETFVEQVLALSLSRSAAEFPRRLMAIRFDGGEARPWRRHYTVVRGWLAKNQAARHLEDITRRIGGAATRTAVKDLTPVGWSPRYLERYMSQGVHAPTGQARIDYIPWKAAIRLVTRIPHGTVIHVVSAPHPRSPYLVTHVGLGISHSRWGTVFRHASQSPRRRRVEDRPLGPYLYYISRTPSGPEMRRGIGIHLSRVTDSR